MTRDLQQSSRAISRTVKLSALLAVLTVALLNPLACLLHCELLQLPSTGSPSISPGFLCHGLPLAALETAVGLATQTAQPPHAVYAATLALGLLLPILAAAGQRQAGMAAPVRRRTPDAPPVPPPRLPR